MPVAIGSTTPRTASAAIAASTALPPSRSTWSAASTASGCPDATMQRPPVTPAEASGLARMLEAEAIGIDVFEVGAMRQERLLGVADHGRRSAHVDRVF